MTKTLDGNYAVSSELFAMAPVDKYVPVGSWSDGHCSLYPTGRVGTYALVLQSGEKQAVLEITSGQIMEMNLQLRLSNRRQDDGADESE